MQRFGKLILGEQIDLNVKKVYHQKIVLDADKYKDVIYKCLKI